MSEDNTDYLGHALELESASKKVESQTAERAMLAGAHCLRIAEAARKARLAGMNATPAAPQDERDQIRSVFLENGFTIKPGHDDLQPYVYAAAKALLRRAALPAAQPADEQKAARYRLLGTADIIQRGDQFIDDDGKTWNEIAGWESGMRYNPCVLKSGRRRIDATDTSARTQEGAAS